MAAKHNEADESQSSAGFLPRVRKAASDSPDSFAEMSRWASQIARWGCDAKASAIAAAATIHNGALQPKRSAVAGATSPMIMPPSGTPVCLIEKNRLRRAAGICRIKRSEDAGLMMP